MDRADDAKKRLEAMHEPVPRPTKAAVARNQAEIDSRGQVTIMQWAMGLIKNGPDVSQATTVGEPRLDDPEPISTTKIRQDDAKAFLDSATSRTNSVGVEVTNQPRHRLGRIEQVCDTLQFGLAAAPAIESDSRADSKRFNKVSQARRIVGFA